MIVVSQHVREIGSIWKTWFDKLGEKAPEYENGTHAYQVLWEESQPIVASLDKRLGMLNEDSLSMYSTITKGYAGDILRMLDACQNEDDYQTTVFYCLNALDRLVKVFGKLHKEQFEHELMFVKQNETFGGKREIPYSTQKEFVLRAG